jgi:hypothetical protein
MRKRFNVLAECNFSTLAKEGSEMIFELIEKGTDNKSILFKEVACPVTTKK